MSAVTAATWPSGMGWATGTDPCGASWMGVTCTGAKVTALDLSFYGMVGTLPANLSLAAGLQTLSLTGNRLVWTARVASVGIREQKSERCGVECDWRGVCVRVDE